ncbi:hypothetical protein ACIA03_08605 [Nocardioides sp. NPDC051685]|uniref:hypothetical protein n=1 Tax=Nocardioides sp. NPDC051685 TaxID=3364334 RepID=UPI00379AB6A8
MTVESLTRAGEPTYVLLGRLLPEPIDVVVIASTENAGDELPAATRPLFEFLARPRTSTEMTEWAAAAGEEPDELKSKLLDENIVISVEPGDATGVITQVSDYVLTPEYPRDERVQDGELAAYVTPDGRSAAISRATATLLWDNPERLTIGQWLELVISRGGDVTSFARLVVTDLPRLLNDSAATIRRKAD